MTGARELPEPRRHKPTARLEPVARALLARGCTPTRATDVDSAFGPTKDGYTAVFAEPLDVDWIKERFVLPPAVRYDAEQDVLWDTEAYVSIQGSRPEG